MLAGARARPAGCQGALLLVGYTLGLGIPFIIIAAFYDRSQRLRPVLRPARTGRVARRRAARRGDRRRDDVRLAGAAPALLPVHVVRMTDPDRPLSRRPAAAPPARRHRPVQRPPALTALGVVVVAAVVLLVVTRPMGPGPGPGSRRRSPARRRTSSGAPIDGPPGPASSRRSSSGSTTTARRPSSSQDLDGNPVRLEDLRGKLVWLNFWATWCPPCQGETPILRDLDEAYGDEGLEIVGVAVQETTADNVKEYAERYELGYTIAFDTSADIFRLYKVYALPTQFFIGPDGTMLRRRQRAAEPPGRAGAASTPGCRTD